MPSESGQVNKQERPWRKGTDWAAGWVLRGKEGSHPVLRSTQGRGEGGEKRGLQYIM